MSTSLRAKLALCSAVALTAFGPAHVFAATQPPTAPPLAFQVDEGKNLNAFFRDGPVAAHAILRSGTDPHLIVAFPAGNSGVGLWFEHLEHDVRWTLAQPPAPVTVADEKGRPLHGVSFVIRTRAPRLVFKGAVLSSVRVLRDYQGLGQAPKAVLTAPKLAGATLTWARDRLDGAPGYRLSLQAVKGRIDASAVNADAKGEIELKVTALTGETPLTPLGGQSLFSPRAGQDLTARHALAFLSYREKFLAGSWRFDTYFGRDTLMSVRLMMPALQPDAVEAGLRAVAARLSPAGEVAHEEDIGEFAILDHRKADGSNSDAPTYNYQMIDGDFMLGPVAKAWLLDDPRGHARAASFLAESDRPKNDGMGHTVGADLVKNLRYVADHAAAFAADPRYQNLMALKPGAMTGQWRDSEEGLGRGRYPYDVNAVFTPAALQAAERLVQSGLLDPYLSAEDRKAFAGLDQVQSVWRAKAAALFEVREPNADALAAISAYAKSVSAPDQAALKALDGKDMRFHALSLDADGQPVKIENSDEGFELLFGQPSASEVDAVLDVLMRPFPAGLMTDVGMVVADAAFAPADAQARFTPHAYHGAVIWSWQQAVVAAGIERQLSRSDLPAETRARLVEARARLWRAIDAAKAFRNSELWSWGYRDGHYVVEAFGANGADADESNAAQLWSTVYLALHGPEQSGSEKAK
jgi:glycogen debranching enzyme